MDEMKLESLKARIARSDYVVDPDAVAEAILRRLLAAQWPGGAGGRGDGSGAGSGSYDVLEPG
jgi:hypothetical protein